MPHEKSALGASRRPTRHPQGPTPYHASPKGGTRSLPRDDDEFSALFDYLRRHTPTAEERARLKTTADVLEREALIDRLARHSCRWLKYRVAELVRREVDRRLAELEQVGGWP